MSKTKNKTQELQLATAPTVQVSTYDIQTALITAKEDERKRILNEFLKTTELLIGKIDLPRKITLTWVLFNLGTAAKFIQAVIKLIRDLRAERAAQTLNQDV